MDYAQVLLEKSAVLSVTNCYINIGGGVTYCYMTSKPMRITDEAERIALKHGVTVSRGIVEMEFQLRKLQTATPVPGVAQVQSARERFVSTPVPSSGLDTIFNQAYWKKLREEIEMAVEPHRGRG